MIRDERSEIDEPCCGTCGGELEWHLVIHEGHIAIALIGIAHGEVGIFDPLA